MNAIGVFGGTFDPIHYGHLRTAFEILQALGLEEVRFVPCGDPPHRGATHATAARRREMVAAAIAGQPGFVLDARELERDGPSYTIDTLASLAQEYSGTPLGLITGMDAFLGLPSWHRWREILDIAHIVVAHRPGWRAPGNGPLGELLAAHGTRRSGDLHDKPHGCVYVQAVTQLEISSTGIRELVAAGGDPRFLVPDPVRDVIAASGCYGDVLRAPAAAGERSVSAPAPAGEEAVQAPAPAGEKSVQEPAPAGDRRRQAFDFESKPRMNSAELSELVVDALDDIKAKDIVKLDVREMTTVTDYMIVASGTSSRHVQALVDNVAEKAKQAGHRPIGVEGEEGGEWVLLDLQDTLVHVMLPKVREFYNLEKLWSFGPTADVALTDA